jgi:monofunctional glycosyltransferase
VSKSIRWLGRWLLRLLLAWLLLTAALTVPLRWLDPPTSAFMLQDRYWHSREVTQAWVPADRISPQLMLAVIAAEDQNFPHHRGIDAGEIRSALEAHQRGGNLRGASTITQQLARNLYLWPQRSWLRKGLELWFAIALELMLSKPRLLEIYLNVIELGDGVYGVEAAAHMFFDRPASAVTAEQAALMATVLPAPKSRNLASPDPLMLERQRWILNQMDNLGLGWIP